MAGIPPSDSHVSCLSKVHRCSEGPFCALTLTSSILLLFTYVRDSALILDISDLKRIGALCPLSAGQGEQELSEVTVRTGWGQLGDRGLESRRMRSCGAGQGRWSGWERRQAGEYLQHGETPDACTSEVAFIRSLQDQTPCLCSSLAGSLRLASNFLFSLRWEERLKYSLFVSETPALEKLSVVQL